MAPAELEGLLLDHPLVNDVAVIGIKDIAQATGLPRAYVVASDSRRAADISEDEAMDIEAWLAQRVAHHKKLRGGLKFVDAIPRNNSGKILREVLRAIAELERSSVGASRGYARL